MEIGTGQLDLQRFEAFRSQASKRLADAKPKQTLEELVRLKREELHKGSPAPAPQGAGYTASKATDSVETKGAQRGRFVDLVA